MRAPYDEGLANHIGRGGRAGQSSSRDRFIPGADTVPQAQGHAGGRAIASAWMA